MTDRDATLLVAEATSQSEQIRGDGDAEHNRIFVDAFGRDPEFAAFYRSMQGYDTGLLPESTCMPLPTNLNSSGTSSIPPAGNGSLVQ
jgi:membrane protease subunit HflC